MHGLLINFNYHKNTEDNIVYNIT